MSKNAQDSVYGNRLTTPVILGMLAKNIKKLPNTEQKLITYGPPCLGGIAGLAGLISNSLYRRALNVTQAPLASGLPMAVLPFLTTYAIYNSTVSVPLMCGDLYSYSHALLRGALIGLVGGGVYPILLALPLNMALATKYNTALIPEKGNLPRYWVDLSRPILRRMRAVPLLQALFGTYLGSRHFDSYTKLAQITFGPGREELQD